MKYLKRAFACIVLACVSLAAVATILLFAIDVESFKLIFGKWLLIEVIIVAVLWYPFIRRRLA
jgi:hypothetical protein